MWASPHLPPNRLKKEKPPAAAGFLTALRMHTLVQVTDFSCHSVGTIWSETGHTGQTVMS